jgi:dolichol-phosphate mannosyltransferase
MAEHTFQNINQVSLGIVCPMANERQKAVEFIDATLAQCDGFKHVTFFAVLDNVSIDGTVEILRELENQQPKLKIIWAPENKCVVDAYLRGYKEALNAGCDWILEIDASFSHQPYEIPQFFEKMLQGYDCVFGSRFCDGGSMAESSLKRRLISRGGSIMANLLLGTKLKDMTSGFELFTHQALETVLEKGIKSKAHFFQTEIKAYCRNLKIAELPITYRAPSASVNNAVLRDALVNLSRLFLLRLRGRL